MTITLGVGDIAILIVAIAFLALVFALIPMLLQVKKTVKAMGDLAGESKTTVTNLNNIITKTGEQTKDLGELTAKIKEVGMKLVNLIEMVLDTIKNPLITLLGLLLGIEYGFKKLCKKDKKED